MHPTASTHELEHLYNAFNRLLEVGEPHSRTIENLKRIVVLRIAELEAFEDLRPARPATLTHAL